MGRTALLVTNRRAVTKSFGKTDKDVKDSIKAIKNWFKTQPHLPEVPRDNMVEMFLVTNKFSIERTKQKMDMYYTIRSLIPEVYSDSNPCLTGMQEAFEMGYCIPLPKLTKELFRVNVMKVLCQPSKFDTYKFFAHQVNILEVRAQEDLALGDVVVVDLEHLKIGHLAKVTPMHLKKASNILENVFSNRIKRIHIINYPSYVDNLLNICRRVLKAKIFERITLHSSNEDLCSHIPLEILPNDYGGEEQSLGELNDLWKIKLEEYGERFDELDKMKIKESLRPASLQNHDVLGYHGNFQKLDVD